VPPPGVEGWTERAVNWLLDQCPPEYRSYEVLRAYPVALSRLTAHHVEAELASARRGYASARAGLRELIPAEAIERVLVAYEREGARLTALQRSVDLVDQALQGRQFRTRL
jgi:hypothetical protein